MQEEIFREKSLNRVKSPESLDDYIRVSNPGVWLLLVSVIALLTGLCVWGIFGHVDSTVEAGVYAEDGTVVCRVAGEDGTSVAVGMTVAFGGYELPITEVVRGEEQTYVCSLQAEQAIPDGFYEGKIVVDSIAPLSFVLN